MPTSELTETKSTFSSPKIPDGLYDLIRAKVASLPRGALAIRIDFSAPDWLPKLQKTLESKVEMPAEIRDLLQATCQFSQDITEIHRPLLEEKILSKGNLNASYPLISALYDYLDGKGLKEAEFIQNILSPIIDALKAKKIKFDAAFLPLLTKKIVQDDDLQNICETLSTRTRSYSLIVLAIRKKLNNVVARLLQEENLVTAEDLANLASDDNREALKLLLSHNPNLCVHKALIMAIEIGCVEIAKLLLHKTIELIGVSQQSSAKSSTQENKEVAEQSATSLFSCRLFTKSICTGNKYRSNYR